MKKIKKQKAVMSFLGVLVAIFLLFSSGLRFPVLDREANIYFNDSIAKAGVAYATCRLINASISIFKDSTLDLEPAGVGLTLAIGQALDPIDDMTERVSDVLVTAITSLGVQKLAYEISLSLVPPIFAIFLFILSIIIWFDNEMLAFIQKNLIKLMLLILILRLTLPVSAIANNYIQRHFFSEKISKVKKELSFGSKEIDKFMKFSLPKIDGVLGTIKNSASFLKRKSLEFKNAMIALIKNTGNIIDSLLELIFLYVGIFLIQVIALPIIVFWMFVKFANSLFSTNIPTVLNHSRIAGSINNSNKANTAGAESPTAD